MTPDHGLTPSAAAAIAGSPPAPGGLLGEDAFGVRPVAARLSPTTSRLREAAQTRTVSVEAEPERGGQAAEVRDPRTRPIGTFVAFEQPGPLLAVGRSRPSAVQVPTACI
jgi:hypothetical protein